MVVKIAPDLSIEQIDIIAALLPRHGVDGVIATNTTLSREAVRELPHANETGGLSGPPVQELSLRVIERLRQQSGADFPIIGVGCVVTGKQAKEKFAAGENAIQLYTGLIYKGPHIRGESVVALGCNVQSAGREKRWKE